MEDFHTVMERLKEEAGRRAGIAQRKQLQEEEQKRLKRLEEIRDLKTEYKVPHFRWNIYKTFKLKIVINGTQRTSNQSSQQLLFAASA